MTDFTPVHEEHREIKQRFSPYLNSDDIMYIIEGGSLDCMGGLILAEDFPNAQIYCFEPNPLQKAICQVNADKHPNIHFIPKGLTNENCTRDFYSVDARRNGNIGVSSLFPFDDNFRNWHTWWHLPPTPIECVNLYSWCQEQEIPHIDIIDLDIQGAELPCLYGMGDYIQNLKAIKIEVNLTPYYLGGQADYKEIDKFMGGVNFQKIYEDTGNGMDKNAYYVNRDLIL